ncbi:hypothetical protein [Spirillospora sp. NPDC029432]|uniref:hypothetical protein n=1 Tax=Spirillospora sp. NPDC029432 TaxID=3154599 RepID=UPI00345687F3
MRRAMSYVAPWAMVTALAVALSWLGVRDVVRGAISDRSSPPPVTGPVIHGSPSPPGSVGTAAARPSPRETPRRSPEEKETASGTAKPSPSRRHGNVRSYSTRGGRAALAVSERRVQLVSATPNAGYETRVTENDGWLRVDFLADRRTSSVIASFYNHRPTVEVYEYGSRA